MRLFRRSPRPAELPREVTALEFFKAQVAPDFSGWWVYAFADRGEGGRVWYAGQTDHLWSRWRDHYYTFKERFTDSVKYVVPVRDQAHADLVELQLIEFYQPEGNTVGRADELRGRLRKTQKPFKPGHGYSQGPRPRQPLDSKQVSN